MPAPVKAWSIFVKDQITLAREMSTKSSWVCSYVPTLEPKANKSCHVAQAAYSNFSAHGELSQILILPRDTDNQCST